MPANKLESVNFSINHNETELVNKYYGFAVRCSQPSAHIAQRTTSSEKLTKIMVSDTRVSILHPHSAHRATEVANNGKRIDSPTTTNTTAHIIIKTAKANENKIKLHATLNISPRCRQCPRHAHTTLPLVALFLSLVRSFRHTNVIVSRLHRNTHRHHILFIYQRSGATSADICSWSVYELWAHLFNRIVRTTMQPNSIRQSFFFFDGLDGRFMLITQRLCECRNLMPRSSYRPKSTGSTVDHTCIVVVTHRSTK